MHLHCGNVNPEQLFDIVEAQTVDEYGRKTQTRRTSPKEWNDFYTIMLGNTLPPAPQRSQPVKRASKVANGLGQWLTYLKREVLTKARNSRYVLVKALEAPALALLLAGFMIHSTRVQTTRSGRARTFHRFCSFPSSSRCSLD